MSVAIKAASAAVLNSTDLRHINVALEAGTDPAEVADWYGITEDELHAFVLAAPEGPVNVEALPAPGLGRRVRGEIATGILLSAELGWSRARIAAYFTVSEPFVQHVLDNPEVRHQVWIYETAEMTHEAVLAARRARRAFRLAKRRAAESQDRAAQAELGEEIGNLVADALLGQQQRNRPQLRIVRSAARLVA